MSKSFTASNRRQSNVCHFFAAGRCRSGPRCTFLHIVQTDGLAQSDFAMPPVQQPQNFGPRISSEPPVLPSSTAPGVKSQPIPVATHNHEATHLVTNEETSVPEEAWIRHLKGAFITFGHGAQVAAVVLPWELAGLRVTKLPKESSSSTISAHFRENFGLQVPESQISTQPIPGVEGVADMTLDDPKLAAALVAALGNDNTTPFKSMPILPPQLRAAHFNRISCNRVNCSWLKPSRTAWLTFGSQNVADKVCGHFQTGVFRVQGTRVLPTKPTPSETDGVNAQTWGVKIANVPAAATRTEIVHDIPSSMRPSHMELSRESYCLPLEGAVNQISNMLMQIGPLECSVAAAPDSHAWRSRIGARFVNPNDATDAVKILHYKPLPFYLHGRLTVQQVFTVRIKVPDHIYLAALQDIEALIKYWTTRPAKQFTFTIPPSYKNFRKIKIDGPSQAEVAEAQAGLESVMAGELLTDDGEPLWSPSFATNAWAYAQMRNLERRLGILVLRDRQKGTLRMLGPRDMFGQARLEIVSLCSKDPRCEFFIRLDSEALPWILRGGYRHIAKVVGIDKVGLDIVSEPRRLIISGSQADLNVAQDIYHNRSLILNPELSLGPSDCAATSSARAALKTCASPCAATHVRTPAVRCYGDFGRCKEVFSLEMIRDNISSVALERLFEVIFTTFVTSNAKQYRYCPTTGCNQVYRVDPQSDCNRPTKEFEFNCPHCLVAICSICHVSHDTLVCPLWAQSKNEAL
ncbi:hypothetical protein NQ176_g9295 [Zarea fungicola]|uniref:Uncharacterized protein n=1 Tax=Zarea fungicola TaxID=93591 RepID=A0ACC1MND1_9HYPO|nr:hypothetical protein NQ176_g9295 [Lecanicillium fungicola]